MGASAMAAADAPAKNNGVSVFNFAIMKVGYHLNAALKP
jgi:hypothetical protein